jgi:GTPase SAR1 family protein
MKWAKEVKKHAPGIPFILVGTQAEHRNDDSKGVCSFKKGKALAKKIRAVKYFEVSAKNNVRQNSFPPTFDLLRISRMASETSSKQQ